MAGFTEIAQTESMQKVYGMVIDRINPQAHPEFLQRPIRVLDIGGGAGEVGKLLKSSCEAALGSLNGEEFDGVVDYVNLDVDRHALAGSVGRVVYGSMERMLGIFGNEKPFDYILNLNPNPEVTEYTPERLNQMGITRDYVGIRENLLNSTYIIKSHLTSIVLIGSALLLREGGQYIHAGFVLDDFVRSLMEASRSSRLGFKIQKDEVVTLDENTVKLFVELDTGFKKGKLFDEAVKQYSRMYRLVALEQTGRINRETAVESLGKEIVEYSKWINYCQAQERFWS